MKCPLCGGELKRGSKNPEYWLCYNCRKKYKWKEQEDTAYKNNSRNHKNNKGGGKGNFLLWLLLIVFPVIGIIYMWIFKKVFPFKRKMILTAIFAIWFCVCLFAFSNIGDEGEKEAPETKSQSQDVEGESFSSPVEIVKKYFPESDVEYNEENKELHLTAKVDDQTTGNMAFATNGGKLARCIGETMVNFPDTNWGYVTIYSDAFPNIITCSFIPESVKSITDWDNFTQSDLSSVCDAYSDSRTE